MEPDVDISELIYNSLKLLGFVFEEYSIKPKELFKVAQKKLFQDATYFLLSQLDKEKAAGEFRSCWPIVCAKDERMFTKVCSSWMKKISLKEGSWFPSVAPSMFLSPGGIHFCEIYLAFSLHVVHEVFRKEYSEYPVFSPQAIGKLQTSSLLKLATHKAIADFLNLEDQLWNEKQQWESHLREVVSDIETMTRNIKEKERVLGELKTKLDELRCGSGDGDSNDVTAFIDKEKFQELIQKWKLLGILQDKIQQMTNQILEIAHRKESEAICLDATKWNFHISPSLLELVKTELEEANVMHIKWDGKVDLISLIKMWKILINAMDERIKELSEGMSSLEKYTCCFKEQLEHHRFQISEMKTLRQEVLSAMITEHRDSANTIMDSLIQDVDTSQIKSLEFPPALPPMRFTPELSHKYAIDDSLLQLTPDNSPDSKADIIKKTIEPEDEPACSGWQQLQEEVACTVEDEVLTTPCVSSKQRFRSKIPQRVALLKETVHKKMVDTEKGYILSLPLEQDIESERKVETTSEVLDFEKSIQKIEQIDAAESYLDYSTLEASKHTPFSKVWSLSNGCDEDPFSTNSHIPVKQSLERTPVSLFDYGSECDLENEEPPSFLVEGISLLDSSCMSETRKASETENVAEEG